MAPLALAFERYLECQIYQNKAFTRPILDLGCGDGLNSFILFDEKIDTGIDQNGKELQRAADLDMYNELIECTGDRIPRPDGSFHTIFSNSVIEHIYDIDSVFKEINRLLVLGGRFYMTVPSPHFEHNTGINMLLMKIGLHGTASRYRKFCSRFIWKQYHYKPVDEWSSLLIKNGFMVVDAFTYGSRFQCLLNNLFYPFGIFGLMMKHLFNRWVVFPNIRKVVLYPVFYLARKKLIIELNPEKGGLLFIESVKVKQP